MKYYLKEHDNTVEGSSQDINLRQRTTVSKDC